MSVPDISVEVAKKVTAIGNEIKSRAVRGSHILKNAELQVLRGQRGRGENRKKRRKPNMKSYYTASAPGEPPAVRSGILRNSFRPTSKTSGGSALSVKIAIETNAHYAGFLEDGTSKMAARPYVEKIKQQAKPEIIRIFSTPYNV